MQSGKQSKMSVNLWLVDVVGVLFLSNTKHSCSDWEELRHVKTPHSASVSSTDFITGGSLLSGTDKSLSPNSRHIPVNMIKERLNTSVLGCAKHVRKSSGMCSITNLYPQRLWGLCERVSKERVKCFSGHRLGRYTVSYSSYVRPRKRYTGSSLTFKMLFVS